jgi:sugar lactone lactonase YvrE
MQLVKRLDVKPMFVLAAVLLSLSLPAAADAQVPAVGFTYQVGEGGLGSTPGANDYNGTAGHMAANTRGDVFVDVAACLGSGCATINNTYLLEIPAGTIATPSSQVALVTNMTTGYGGHSVYVDSSSNVWVADTGDAQIIFVPFLNGSYPASINHSAMGNCAAFPVPASTTTACIVPLNYPSSLGNYVQAIDVALDGAGNLYMISKYVGGNPSTQVNKIIEFNTSNVATVLVDNLSNQVGAEFAVDKLGDIYYEDGTNVSYYAAGSSTAVPMGTGYSSPTGISIDTGGNVYLTDSGNKRMVEFPSINGSITLANQFTLASNYSCNGSGGFSEGPGIDGFGNLYYSSSYPNGICVTRVGYYNVGTINPYYVNPSGSELDMNFHSAATLGSFAIAGVGASNFSVNSTTAGTNPSTCTAGSYAAGTTCKLYVNYAETFVTGPESAFMQALDGSGNVLGVANMITYGSESALNVDPGTMLNIGSGWSAPSAVATDGTTKLYIADAGTGKIYQSVSAAAPTVIASGLSAPSAIAVDSAENLYVADTGEVVEYPYNSTTSTYGSKVQLVSGLSGASGLAINTFGYLFVADSGNGRVLQLSQLNRVGSQPLAAVVGTVPGSFSIPVAVAVDNLGNLFVSDFGAKKLYKIVLTTSAQTTLLSGLTNPAGVAVDEGGSVFLADSGTLTITRIPAIAGVLTPASKTTLASPVVSPSAIAIDKAGNIYATDASNMAVAEDNRNTGALNFGNVVAGSTSAPLTATLTNAGVATFNFYYQGPLTGSGTNNFTENSSSSCYNSGNTTSLTLTAGASCAYTATYAPPTATGYQTWNVTFSGTGDNNNTAGQNFNGASGQSFNVIGTGISSSTVTITGPGSAAYGATTQYTVTATTPGTYTVSITGTATSSTSVTVGSGGTGTFNLPPALGVGSYTLSVTIASVTGTEVVTVTPASLTATATSVSRQFDVANPTLTCTYSGYKNGDTSSVVSGSCGISTLATRVSPAAIYQIIPTAGTATAANYTVNTFVDGTLTVTGSVPQTIFFPPLPNFTHGATTYQLSGIASSGLPLSYTVTSGTASISGSTLTVTGAGAVTIAASQGGNSTYAAAIPIARSFTAQ